MVKGISAVEAVGSPTKGTTKGIFRRLAQSAREDQAGIFAVSGTIAGLGLYGAALNGYVNGDTVTLAANQAQDLAGKQSFLKRFTEQLKEKFAIDLNNPPAGINTSEPYMMDRAGHYIMDEYGAIPNPWFNPETLDKGISAVESMQFNPITMDSFLEHAAARSAEGLSTAASMVELPFSGVDVPEVDDSLLEIIANGIRNIFDGISDLI